MSSSAQTVIALFAVAAAVLWLLRSALRRKPGSSCGDSCGAVSSEVRELQKRIRRR